MSFSDQFKGNKECKPARDNSVKERLDFSARERCFTSKSPTRHPFFQKRVSVREKVKECYSRAIHPSPSVDK